MKYFLIYLLFGILTSFGTHFHDWRERRPILLKDIMIIPLDIIFWVISFPAYLWQEYDINGNKIIFQRPPRDKEFDNHMKDLLDP